jgi:hypothetical protein
VVHLFRISQCVYFIFIDREIRFGVPILIDVAADAERFEYVVFLELERGRWIIFQPFSIDSRITTMSVSIDE